eukprot:TRINITY_DN29495_c0_g1_i1.p1 TRINITY_DN29495_c0_g1~~TRINITY_DN29495_c0_g1_i1.p1  ORF type:complete len:224 (+),score=16.72 TRINITY_DN29495_c0_g1_i1:714-1385(+)
MSFMPSKSSISAHVLGVPHHLQVSELFPPSDRRSRFAMPSAVELILAAFCIAALPQLFKLLMYFKQPCQEYFCEVWNRLNWDEEAVRREVRKRLEQSSNAASILRKESLPKVPPIITLAKRVSFRDYPAMPRSPGVGFSPGVTDAEVVKQLVEDLRLARIDSEGITADVTVDQNDISLEQSNEGIASDGITVQEKVAVYEIQLPLNMEPMRDSVEDSVFILPQ